VVQVPYEVQCPPDTPSRVTLTAQPSPAGRPREARGCGCRAGRVAPLEDMDEERLIQLLMLRREKRPRMPSRREQRRRSRLRLRLPVGRGVGAVPEAWRASDRRGRPCRAGRRCRGRAANCAAASASIYRACSHRQAVAAALFRGEPVTDAEARRRWACTRLPASTSCVGRASASSRCGATASRAIESRCGPPPVSFPPSTPPTP
jgi:hypothetical protein